MSTQAKRSSVHTNSSVSDDDEHDFVRSEILCYIQNNFATISKQILVSRVCAHYEAKEIVDGKVLLFSSIEKFCKKERELPKIMPRKAGDSKSKLDADDTIEAFRKLADLDIKAPTFYAVNLKKIPPPIATELDINALTASIAKMSHQVENGFNALLNLQINESSRINREKSDANAAMSSKAISSNVFFNASSRTNVASSQNICRSNISLNELPTCSAQESKPHGLSNWEDSLLATTYPLTPAAHTQTYNAPQVPVIHHPKLEENNQKNPWKRVEGRRKNKECKLKTVPRKISVFVGRLHIDTQEADVVDYLAEKKLIVTNCKRLEGKSKTGYEFKSAAFLVTIEDANEDVIYDEDTWPDNAIVKQWKWLPKKPKNSKDDASNNENGHD